MNHLYDEIKALKRRISEIDVERERLLEKLNSIERVTHKKAPHYTSTEKIHIFRQLFRGREDVFPKRWENRKTGRSGYSPACSSEWVRGVCEKPKIKCTECPNQAFIKLSDDIIRKHLTGRNARHDDYTIGVYPLLTNETCWFLAVDFDKETWKTDISAFVETCKNKDVPAYIERSRSGNGGHIWIFFSTPVSASDARSMGAFLLTETMDKHPYLSFSSYDRLFPNQDKIPTGGLGNLIALPLQSEPRKNGNSVFVDSDFEPYPDQWAFLSTVKRMSADDIRRLVSDATRRDGILGERIRFDDEDSQTPWKARPSRNPLKPKTIISLPERVNIILGNQLYIAKSGLPPPLINRLKRTAAFQNPEFYKAQAMRLPVFNKPRMIACAENYACHIGLPRGCLDHVLELFNELNVKYDILDKRNSGTPIITQFTGTLDKEQKAAAQALMAHDNGVLSAATGFGKTVLAAEMIAKRQRNTLILVHRKHLLEQWIDRLHTFLNLNDISIGQMGGGKRSPRYQIDVALIQSLIRQGEVNDCVAEYGQLIIDECHHVSAVSFEAVARRCKAKYVLGLTATPKRRDGQQAIIFMQCGPIRHHIDAKKQARKRRFSHFVTLRRTEFELPLRLSGERGKLPIQTVYTELVTDSARNEMIVADVMTVLKAGRSPVILTERKEHVAFFANRLSYLSPNIISLQGGMGRKAHAEMMAKLRRIDDDEERILIATGRYIGEGFDDARLDTLFLALPVSWRGTLEQYAGRLHRSYHKKTEVQIYDYIDVYVPVLKRMSDNRMRGYKSFGYEIRPA